MAYLSKKWQKKHSRLNFGFSIMQTFKTFANLEIMGSGLTRKVKEVKNSIPDIGKDYKGLLNLHIRIISGIASSSKCV